MQPAIETRGRWQVVTLVFLILNVAIGVNFAGYGALVEAIQREYDTSRALASAGLSMLTLALGLLSPMVGGLMRRFPIRWLMALGILLNTSGYLLLRWTSSIYEMLAIYALLIGPGFSLFSVVPCTTIISNWFDAGRGRALGIINMPVGNAILPIAAAAMLMATDLATTFTAAAILLLCLFPLLLLFSERPRTTPVATSEQAATPPPVATLSSMAILRSPAFLILTLGVGVLTTGGLVIVTHVVALGQGRGLDVTSASLLLAAFGFAGLAGAPLAGWLADRMGPGYAFAIVFFASILPWLGLMVVGSNFAGLMLCALCIGMCSNATMPLFGVSTGAWLGAENISLSMGLSYMLQIPFMFGAGPVAGAIYDASGSYTLTILILCAAFAFMGVVFLLYAARRRAVAPALA